MKSRIITLYGYHQVDLSEVYDGEIQKYAEILELLKKKCAYQPVRFKGVIR